MAEVIEVEIEQASEQEQRGREDEVVSVLSSVRPPVASDLSRKRKLVTNPEKGNRRSNSKSSSPDSTAAKSEPKSISAKDRAKQFKDEPFTAQAKGGLFCTACRELVSLKKQNIHVHISSKKTQGEQRKAVAERQERRRH